MAEVNDKMTRNSTMQIAFIDTFLAVFVPLLYICIARLLANWEPQQSRWRMHINNYISVFNSKLHVASCALFICCMHMS